ncbi:hypothetical protein N5T78_02365 [Aliarcobacter cryaerophilus]|uniref:hypothetical protein n=1 Tax=Aliarcobacter cryaerophilus TaxID=28198 RepID=UPI0021B54484|nr:hypothetical protein [Aliarcobacter cryaerophilus]MCT7465424.1 hypothetical protein [Aliarcobacter cryaerophilus]
MGINIILPLIIGMALMVSLGSQVVPSFVEQMKVAKVENRTISNQNLIKDAIVRYIKMEKKVPKNNDLEVLEKYGLLRGYHNDNLFGGGYGFTIDKKKGILKIFTTINDEGAGKYFSNSFKFPNTPKCIEDQNGVCTGTFETFYFLDEDTFKSIPVPEVGSIEWVEDKYSKENLGDRYEEKEIPLVGGEIDYVVDVPNNKVIEYIYDIDKKEWVKSGTSFGGNFTNDPIPNIIEFAEKYPNLNNYIKNNPDKVSYMVVAFYFNVPSMILDGSSVDNNDDVLEDLKNFVVQERKYFFYEHTNYYPEITLPYPIDNSIKVTYYYKSDNSINHEFPNCDGTKFSASMKSAINLYIIGLLDPSEICANKKQQDYLNRQKAFFSDFKNQINIAPLFQNP